MPSPCSDSPSSARLDPSILVSVRLAAVLVLLVWVCAPVLAQEMEYVPPTERYEIPWGATPAEVVEQFGRQPDAEGPGASLTYVGAGGGQAVFVFAIDTDGVYRLGAAVDSTPVFENAAEDEEHHALYKAALIRLYGPPLLDESPRDDGSGISDTAWDLEGGEIRAVELTRDVVVQDSATRPFFYVRVVGPAITD